ncbi:uncharacterized protein [Typha latifolia]|uniref:uncharacterized protein isoform X1 n=1 Tax=Typha latifolia TaxID=4733 RepID=UPI003C2DE918
MKEEQDGEMVPTNTFDNAAVKVKKEKREDEVGDGLNSHKILEEGEGEEPSKIRPSEEAMRPRYGSYRGALRHIASEPTLAVNRRRLGRLLQRLVRAHNWKEASGVLSVLLKGTPRGSSLSEDRRNFLVAMEIQKRLGGGSYYQTKIKKMYEVWMSKLAWTKKCSRKRHLIQLELALFYLKQGNVQEAYNTTKFLVQDRDSATEPVVNLMHGLILYHLWYSGLPEEMQIKGFDIRITSETAQMVFNDGYEETGMLESSDDHNAVNIENATVSSQLESESSVGNNKDAFMEYKSEVPRKQPDVSRPAHDFYLSGSEKNDERATSTNLHVNFQNSSIFLARGLDTSLLPIKLKHHLAGDLEQSIYLHRRLADENYRDAVRHLRLALYSSTPPLMASLLPLIQLLLLGDNVEEALIELEKSCLNSSRALPFRLRARLLECFHGNQATTISSCYEDALKRDPTEIYSLERLVKMHRSGNYSTMQLLEMITLHLDSTDAKSSVWEEFASCFLKIRTSGISDYEDRISANVQGGLTGIISSSKIPEFFGHKKDTWQLRCRWWVNRHFSKNSFLTEIEAGDWKLLTSKAACASHLYGPKFEYVKAVVSSLGKEGNNDQITFLRRHMQSSLKLHQHLDGASSI